jgi:hypothetical protein
VVCAKVSNVTSGAVNEENKPHRETFHMWHAPGFS